MYEITCVPIAHVICSSRKYGVSGSHRGFSKEFLEYFFESKISIIIQATKYQLYNFINLEYLLQEFLKYYFDIRISNSKNS